MQIRHPDINILALDLTDIILTFTLLVQPII